MASFTHTLANRLLSKDARKSSRKKIGSKAWIRPDSGFSIRECTVADISDTGIRLTLDSPQTVADHFNLLLSRGEGKGRRCRVKWRRGRQLGAQFI